MDNPDGTRLTGPIKMFEVYECYQGREYLLLVTSDRVAAQAAAAESHDRVNEVLYMRVEPALEGTPESV
jgi:hypothetical protein